MSVHKSLKTKGLGTKHRNVLSREERILKLREAGNFEDGNSSPYGLAKVRSIKIKKG